MGMEKRGEGEPFNPKTVVDPEGKPLGPQAPTTDIVHGDEVVRSAEDIAAEMNSQNPDGPKYAPSDEVPEGAELAAQTGMGPGSAPAPNVLHPGQPTAEGDDTVEDDDILEDDDTTN